MGPGLSRLINDFLFHFQGEGPYSSVPPACFLYILRGKIDSCSFEICEIFKFFTQVNSKANITPDCDHYFLHISLCLPGCKLSNSHFNGTQRMDTILVITKKHNYWFKQIFLQIIPPNLNVMSCIVTTQNIKRLLKKILFNLTNAYYMFSIRLSITFKIEF